MADPEFSDSLNIGDVIQSWFAGHGISDTDSFTQWIAAMRIERLDPDALLVRAGDLSRQANGLNKC
jgi:hypothetical protein